jgi:hypothetical protein
MADSLVPLGPAALALIVGQEWGKHLDPQRFARLLESPRFFRIQGLFVATKAYQQGEEAGLRFLQLEELFQGSYTEREHEEHLMKIYRFILCMLDKGDKWQEYIDLWQTLRSNTNFRFFPREECHWLESRFLMIRHRKDVNLRKIAKKKAQQKMGKSYHLQQADYPPEEISRRYYAVLSEIIENP